MSCPVDQCMNNKCDFFKEDKKLKFLWCIFDVSNKEQKQNGEQDCDDWENGSITGSIDGIGTENKFDSRHWNLTDNILTIMSKLLQIDQISIIALKTKTHFFFLLFLFLLIKTIRASSYCFLDAVSISPLYKPRLLTLNHIAKYLYFQDFFTEKIVAICLHGASLFQLCFI